MDLSGGSGICIHFFIQHAASSQVDALRPLKENKP